MQNEIYIQLLDEGTAVYRPVLADEVGNGVYHVKGHDIYDPEDEKWEFIPGTKVVVEERVFDGDIILVAVRKA